MTGSPWIYGLIGLSVLLDVFLPMLPSGLLVIAAAAAAAGAGAAGTAAQGAPGFVVTALPLLLCAATASVLGDLAAFRIAWRGGVRFDAAIARSRWLTGARERLGQALSGGGGILVVLARFAPAGRSLVSFAAGVAHRQTREFLPWSALAGLSWAAYSVTLGWFGGRWFDEPWIGTLVSLLALCASGPVAVALIRRRRHQEEAAEATAA